MFEDIVNDNTKIIDDMKNINGQLREIIEGMIGAIDKQDQEIDRYKKWSDEFAVENYEFARIIEKYRDQFGQLDEDDADIDDLDHTEEMMRQKGLLI
jgi:hypothetical protein